MTGYTLDEVKGHKPGHLLQGADTDPATVAAIRHALATRAPIDCEIYNYRKGGAGYWALLSIMPVLNEHGRPEGLIAVHTDVTEQKRAEPALSECEGGGQGRAPHAHPRAHGQRPGRRPPAVPRRRDGRLAKPIRRDELVAVLKQWGKVLNEGHLN